jgi:RNA polymerase sigma-70 factor (ECF subfamily)
MKSDAELFAAAITAGPEAFTPIIDRYGDAVFGIALSRLRDFHQAEDVAQDVFIAAFERLGNLRDPSRLGAWLRSVTIHHCIDHLRKEREGNTGERLDMHPGSAAAPVSELERMELREQVLAAIARLSKTQRETTTLFYINGYSVAEVADMQEVPVGTVKRRLHDAREKLKTEMLGMVENVLKSESPKEDLPQRVFEAIARRRRDEHDVFVELRRMDARDGIAGLARALRSRRAEMRNRALTFAAWFDAPENRQTVIDLLKQALQDTNAGVRAHAAIVALERFPCEDETKRREFIPRVVELLFDPAKPVRRAAANALLWGWGRKKRSWAEDVPLAAAARAVLDEPDPVTRQYKENLLRTVLDAREPGSTPPPAPQDVEDRLRTFKERLGSPSNAVRAGQVQQLADPGMPDEWKRREVIPLVIAMLSDRSRRVRWRTAYELCAWAADVPIEVVEKACRAEPHTGTRQMMERLLRMATREQERGT